MENDSQLVRWRCGYCCPPVIPSALSPTSWETRLSFTIPSSCPIRGRREPISREVMLGSSGGPFCGFCSCRATHASSRGTTTVQTDATPLGRAPLLPRGAQSAFEELRREQVRQAPDGAGSESPDACTDAVGPPGKPRRRSAAATRERRSPLSENPAQRFRSGIVG